MLKNTSLASTIAFAEIYFVTEDIAAVNFDVPQLLIVGCIWYLALTSVLYVGQYYLERYYARGSSRELPPTPWQRIRRGFFTSGHDPVALAPLAFERHEGGGGMP